MRQHAQLLKRYRLTRRQDTHDDVFHAAGGRNGGNPQFDIERTVFLEFDLAVLRFAAFRNIEIAHDLDTREQSVAIAGRNLDVVFERTVLAEADDRLVLARTGLDVDIRYPLAVGVDNNLVDQFDQLILGGGCDVGGRYFAAFFVKAVFHAGQHVGDRGRVIHNPEKLVDCLPELDMRGDLIDRLAARKNIGYDPAALGHFGIDCEDDQALLGILDRQPPVLLDVVALEIFQQIDWLDAFRLERRVRDPEEFAERLADGSQGNLEFIDQHFLDIKLLAPRRTGSQFEFGG